MADKQRQRFFGLLVRKERWGLSWRGRLALVLALLFAGVVLLLAIHPFLVVTHRVPAKTLVVEGWVHDFGVQAAAEEFKAGHYDRLLTTGGPEEGYGPSSSVYNTDAYQTAGRLRKAGIPASEVQAVPCRFVGKDRTYNSALTLRHWLHDHNLNVRSFNVLTEDAHARRTWMLFREAFGTNADIGIIAVPDPDYDAKQWWRSSEGVREIIDESIAYIYAKFFFWPGKPQDH